MQGKEYTQEDFLWTQWTTEEIKEATKEMLSVKREAIEQVKKIAPTARTFENTLYILEHSNAFLWKFHAINLLINVSQHQEIRDAAKQAIDILESALVDMEYDEGVYRVIKEYAIQQNETLTQEEERLLEKTLLKYRRMGFELDKETRQKVQENAKRINELANVFSTNINEYHDEVKVTKEELSGLSEQYIASLKRQGDSFLVSLDYPELNPFLENAINSSKRSELALKSLQKGGKENVRVLEEMIALRDHNARLLGYENHAAFQTKDRMAKNPQTVLDFIADIMERIDPKVCEEMRLLEVVKQRYLPNESSCVAFSDVAFLLNQGRKEHFSINHEALRAYFPLERVKREMMRIFGELFGFRCERVETISLWHESAELWAIRECEGDISAYFALDLFPREGKYGHAAVFNVITGHEEYLRSQIYTKPFATMLANFPAPQESIPSLLSHAEVVTFFHEFGHILHEVLTKVRLQSQAGFATALDFVEAPSQLLENWAWDKSTLQSLAEHYQTKEKLSSEVIDRLLASRSWGLALTTMRQMVLAQCDMELHMRGIEGDMNDAYARMVERSLKVPLPKEHLFLAGFGHLTHYDAGYYGYMWSKGYALDMFSVFEKEGMSNLLVGARYRQWVLALGGSRDEMELVKGFLQREPSSDAFVRSLWF
jgi:thimet oligopeptidase